MSLNPLRWKTRTIVHGVLGALLLYTLFVYKKKYQVTFGGTINNSDPEVVWEFMADFSNVKKLNPTIEDFYVIEESGNLVHWKYSVRYTEHLSQLPMIRNVAYGHYSVKRDDNGFVIGSRHQTCFFFNFGCLESVSQFRFDADGADTRCTETVEYECPITFSPLCRREVMYQREEIMRRLKSEFAVGNRKVN